jgi:hypothetical protein
LTQLTRNKSHAAIATLTEKTKKKNIRLVITREALVEIVKEEVLTAFPELDDFRRWAHGIMHEEELEEVGNPFHQKDGTFGSEDDATCVSTYFQDKKRKRVGGSLKDKVQTGRGPKKTSQGKYRCHDNSPKWESIHLKSSDGDRSATEASDEQIKAYVKAVVSKEVIKALKAQQSAKTGCSVQDLLNFNDRYSRSMDGELTKAKK